MHNKSMANGPRIIIASTLLLIAVLGTIGVATQIEIAYYLPPASTGTALKKITLFGPAVAGTIFGLLVVIGLVAHLLVTIKRNPPRWIWAAALACTFLAAIAPFIVAAAHRPVF